MNTPNLFKIVGRSMSTLGRHWLLFLAISAFLALPGHGLYEVSLNFLTGLFTNWFPAHGVIISQQQVGILAISFAGLFQLIWICPATALTAPAMYWLFLKDQDNEPVSFSKMFNFALSRWKSIFLPYLVATIIIQIGLAVVIPGVLYGLLYSFVIPLAALDEKTDGKGVRWILSRSTKLTKGRRGRIFRTYLIFGIWLLPYSFAPLMLIDQSMYLKVGVDFLNEIVGALIMLSILQLYLERTEQIDLAKQKRQKKQDLEKVNI